MTKHTDTSRSDDLMERIEGCIANAEYDDEWKTLIDARDHIEALEAENERFEQAMGQRMMSYLNQIEALEAENERLREALIRLRDCDWVITPLDRMDAVRDIARTALGEKQ